MKHIKPIFEYEDDDIRDLLGDMETVGQGPMKGWLILMTNMNGLTTGEIVIAGDTTVAVGRRILPQAADGDMQRGFLELLNGRRHHVLSAVAVIDADGRMRSRLCDSIVRFKRLSSEEIESYIACGEGLAKAGGYAIQGRAEALIDWMAGSHSGVIGLPLYETRSLLRASGYPLA